MTESYLVEERNKEYKEIFELFDVDKDGKLNRKELNTILKILGHETLENSEDDEDIEFNSIFYNFNDFTNILNIRARECDIENELFFEFIKYDTEKTGNISVLDFVSIMKIIGTRFSEEELNELIVELDPENTGLIRLNTLMSKMGQKLFQ